MTKFKRKDPELAVVGGAKRNKKRKCPFVKPKEEAEQEVPPLSDLGDSEASRAF